MMTNSGAAFGLAGHAQRGSCPCGSGAAYDVCCGPVHAGQPASSPEVLMRARFTAFALRKADFLLDTWHPGTRPDGVNLDPMRTWERLHVVDAAGDRVRFRAHFTVGGRRGVLEENSRFAQRGGRWFYVDGEFPQE